MSAENALTKSTPSADSLSPQLVFLGEDATDKNPLANPYNAQGPHRQRASSVACNPFCVESDPAVATAESYLTHQRESRAYPEQYTNARASAVSMGMDIVVGESAQDGCCFCCRTKVWPLFAEWQLHCLVVLLTCALAALTLLIADVVEITRENGMLNTARLALQVSDAGISFSMACVRTHKVTFAALPDDALKKLDVIRKSIRKTQKGSSSKYLSYVDKAEAYAKEADCEQTILTFDQLFGLLSADAMNRNLARSSKVSSFAYMCSLALSHLRSEGILRMHEDAPVTSKRAIQGLSTNTLCSGVISTYVNVTMGNLGDYLNCDKAERNKFLLRVPVVEPEYSPTMLVFNALYSFMMSSWKEASAFKVNKRRYGIAFSHFSVIIVLSAIGFGGIIMNSLHRRVFRREQDIIGQDFGVENKKIVVRAETLRMLDYYCWKLGTLEYVDPDAVLEHDTLSPTTPRLLSPLPVATDADPLLSLSSSQHGAAIPTSPNNAGVLARTTNMANMPSVQTYLSHPEDRMSLLQGFSADCMKMTEATQTHLQIHQAVHPLVLLRPFVPDYMLTPAKLEVQAVSRLGPSVTEKGWCSIMQKGLETDSATYVFISFSSFNAKTTLTTAIQHYVQRDESLRRYAELEEEKQKTNKCCSACLCCGCGGSGSDEVASNRDAQDVLVVQDGGLPGNGCTEGRRLGARFTDDIKGSIEEQQTFNNTNPRHALNAYKISSDGNRNGGADDAGANLLKESTPLSPMATALNYAFACIRFASQLYRGEVVQVASDGVLVQFRSTMDTNTKANVIPETGIEVTANQKEAAKPSANQIFVDGAAYSIGPEERAVRAALLIQESLESYLDLPENFLLPPEMLRCPTVIVKDTACLRGRVDFHVTMQYSVLAQSIPLVFPLERVCTEFGSSIVMTQAVQEHVSNVTLARPIHYMEIQDLCYYCFASQEVNLSVEPQGDPDRALNSPSSATSVAAATAASIAADAAPSPNTQGDAKTDGLTSAATAAGGLTSPSTRRRRRSNSATLENSVASTRAGAVFDSATVVYDLTSVRALNSNSLAYRIFVDTESHSRAQRDHWWLVWSKYENALAQRHHMSTLHVYLTEHKQERALLMAQTEESRRDQQDANHQGKSIGFGTSESSYTETPSVASLSGSTVYAHAQAKDAQLLKATVDILKDCYLELKSYEHIYGLQRREQYAYNKVKGAVVAMLASLDVYEEEIEVT